MNLETSQIREKALFAIEEYNKMIVHKKKWIVNEDPPSIDGFYGRKRYSRALRNPNLLYKNDLMGMLYNCLRRTIFSGNLQLSIAKLDCEFRDDGTLSYIKIKRGIHNFTEINLIEDTLNDMFSSLPEVRASKTENEILLIINSIKIK